MLIRLTRKLANQLDGVDLTDYCNGDVLELADNDARLLIAERWAVPYCDGHPREVRGTSLPTQRGVAADAASRTRALVQARRLRRQMEQSSFDSHERRRTEDEIRDNLHDARQKPDRP